MKTYGKGIGVNRMGAAKKTRGPASKGCQAQEKKQR